MVPKSMAGEMQHNEDDGQHTYYGEQDFDT
jgi:hypothetical protein